MKNVLITLAMTLGLATAVETVKIKVVDLVGDRITDVDEGAVEGIAIIDSSPGWEYSLDDQATWAPIENYSVLLNTSAWLRNPMDSQAQITYRAWDQTEGIVGDGYEIAMTGGESAFSEAAHTVAFVLGSPVDEDMRLPVRWRALSVGGNQASLSNVTYSVEPPEMGTWQPRVATDPPLVVGYFVPAGTIGSCTLRVTGTNRKNQQVSGALAIDVVAGAAQVIEVEAFEQVER